MALALTMLLEARNYEIEATMEMRIVVKYFVSDFAEVSELLNPK